MKTTQTSDFNPYEGYKSPVTMIFDEAIQKMHKQFEDKVALTIVQKVDVDVDKEELLKALRYDRNQYAKGYVAGYQQRIIEEYRKAMLCEHVEEESNETDVQRHGHDVAGEHEQLD